MNSCDGNNTRGIFLQGNHTIFVYCSDSCITGAEVNIGSVKSSFNTILVIFVYPNLELVYIIVFIIENSYCCVVNLVGICFVIELQTQFFGFAKFSRVDDSFGINASVGNINPDNVFAFFIRGEGYFQFTFVPFNVEILGLQLFAVGIQNLYIIIFVNAYGPLAAIAVAEDKVDGDVLINFSVLNFVFSLNSIGTGRGDIYL